MSASRIADGVSELTDKKHDDYNKQDSAEKSAADVNKIRHHRNHMCHLLLHLNYPQDNIHPQNPATRKMELLARDPYLISTLFPVAALL
jgi:hypothetical protein